MDMEEVKKRVLARHHGNEAMVQMFEPINKICDPVGEDEENAVTVTVTSDMTKEDVLAKIVQSVK